MARISVTTNALEKGARMDMAAEAVPVEIVGMMAASGGEVGPAAVEIVKGFTPVRTGKLAGSTEAAVRPRGFYCEVAIDQPATSLKGVRYGDIVRSGRGGIRAGDYGHRALGPMAGIGFRASVGPAAANDYYAKAVPAIRTVARNILRTAGRRAAVRIIARAAG